MNRVTAHWLPAAALLISGAIPLPVSAQDPDLRLPISLDADETNYDGKNSMLMFKGLRLTQGRIGIQADEGRASNLDFENSIWQFSGDVIIDVEDGRIECDTANLKFAGHQLQLATIVGSPATFEMRRPDSDVVTHAEAGRLRYDFAAGIIEFSDDATISEGGNEISSEYLVYNIEEQRINAQSAGEGNSKVKITYTPRDNGAAGGDDRTSPTDSEGDTIAPEDEDGAR